MFANAERTTTAKIAHVTLLTENCTVYRATILCRILLALYHTN